MTLVSLLSQTVGAWWQRPPSSQPADPNPESLDVAGLPPDVRRLIRDRRYCKLLSIDAEVSFDPPSIASAWQAVKHDMALVPAGEVSLVSDRATSTRWGMELIGEVQPRTAVPSLYLDRHCVTNADFARFVAAGGYENPDLWPQEILPNVLQFVDQTGHPGPAFWTQGQPPAEKAMHPVVGVCWYESSAYAIWTGKRLPTSPQWQRAGTWPQNPDRDSHKLCFPWGNAFDPRRANLQVTGIGDTLPVDALPTGGTLNGIQQLVGNVWEWVDAPFQLDTDGDVHVVFQQPMAEIRGGAFDTYFHAQASCYFRSGQPLLYRGANLGFRCCIPSDRLAAPVEAATSLTPESER